jgi:hypothetical protein
MTKRCVLLLVPLLLTACNDNNLMLPVGSSSVISGSLCTHQRTRQSTNTTFRWTGATTTASTSTSRGNSQELAPSVAVQLRAHGDAVAWRLAPPLPPRLSSTGTTPPSLLLSGKYNVGS